MFTDLSVDTLIEKYGTDKTSIGQNYWSTSRAEMALIDQGWGGLMLSWDIPHKFAKLANWEVDLWAYPAMVGVKSSSLILKSGKRANHAVVYCPNRRMILDPQKQEPQPFSKYEFISWQPFVKYLPLDENDLL